MSRDPRRCQDPTRRFKPQWAYETPEGYRDEVYQVEFQFVINGAGRVEWGLPWSLDDDVRYIIRGIFFPQLRPDVTTGNPCLVRIWDSFGNPLSEGLVLSAGMWCLGGLQEPQTNRYGWGWPIEPEVMCSPGGTILFDFQVSTNATIAEFIYSGVAIQIQFSASVWGTAGNAYTIAFIDPGANNVPLSVAVVGNAVQVTLSTNGGGAITATGTQIAALINSTPAAAAKMTVQVFGANPNEVVTAMAATPLTNGVASTPITLNGCFIGVKRFKGC